MQQLEEAELDSPAWASGGFLSDFVNTLIGIKPLFNLMKIGARKVLINTAEKNGVDWKAKVIELKSVQSRLDEHFEQVQNKDIVHPEYYMQEFHAYDQGNTNWLAAMECESATMSMALRVWPKEELSPTQAQDRLRKSFTDVLLAYSKTFSVNHVSNLVDIGCSVGVSTFYLAKAFPDGRWTLEASAAWSARVAWPD